MIRSKKTRLVSTRAHLIVPSRSVGNRHASPPVKSGVPLYAATPSARTEKSGLTASKTFFFGLSTSSGSPGNDAHATIAPFGAEAGGSKGSTFPFEPVPQRTIAVDSTPRIFEGFMFATTTTLLPSISASGTWSTSPETTCLGPLLSPTSMVSTYSFSASGWRQTFVTVPTFRHSLDTSTGASAAAGFFAFSLFSLFSLFSPFSFFRSPEESIFASPSTSCLANRMSPTATFVPAARFALFFKRQMGVAGVPSFSKMAAAASGITGAKKCAATYTASRTDRMMTAFLFSAPSPFTAHGALSVRYLFASFTALMASSHALCVSKCFMAISLCARRAGTSTTGSMCDSSTAGTTPPQFFKHRLVARCTRLPSTSAKSLLCVSTSAGSEKGMSEPYTPPRIR
mmetsp:Transcript_13109/g.55867  ORF Transcript_13109/g.55867 Transcript_13109/m.55867 type:complete len:399 (-) Transcript_13109:813-2009(-)